MNKLVIFVDESNSCRLDTFLASTLEHSRSFIEKLIKNGAIFVDNLPIKKAGYTLKKGQKIVIDFPEIEELSFDPEDIPLDIVFEDDDIAVINKQANLVVHPSETTRNGTLVNALLFHLKNLSSIGGVRRPGIVHRLDKNTTGLIVVAKNDNAHISLSEQMANRTTKKIYTALCEGSIKEDTGIILSLLDRDPKDRKRMAVSKSGGREAKTEYTVLERFQGFVLVSFGLHTGRTHQIRVHAKHMGNPIVGDTVYCFARPKKHSFELSGQLLHSSYLEFTHPATGERVSFSASLPENFEKALKKLRGQNSFA